MYVFEFTDALLPRIALPCSEIRAAVFCVVPTRDTTARDAFATFDDVVRETTFLDETPRDADVLDAVAFARDTVVLGRLVVVVAVVLTAVVGVVVVAREVTPRATVAELVVPVSRDTTFDVVVREVAGLADVRTLLLERGDCTVFVVIVFVGAIGSANTARIDKNVEQTKNAPASKNTVPIAFLQCSAKLRLFINALLCSGKARKTKRSAVWSIINHPPIFYNYNIFTLVCK